MTKLLLIFSLLVAFIIKPSHGFTCEDFLLDNKQDRKICFDDFGYDFRHEPFGLTIEEANEECEDVYGSGGLISIQNEDENKFLINELKYRKLKTVFLGMKTNDEGSYEWLDQSPMIYTNWENGRRPTIEDEFLNPCIEIDVTATNGSWSALGEGVSESCPLVKTDYVCKVPLIPPMESFNHFVSDDRTSWESANDSCSLFRMSLVIINDVNENKMLYELLQQNGRVRKVWIGLSGNKQGKYRWVSDDLSVYRDWCPGHPNDIKIISEVNDCVTYTIDNEKDDDKGCFSVEKCDQVLPFICERETEEQILFRQKISELTKTIRENGGRPYCPNCVKRENEKREAARQKVVDQKKQEKEKKLRRGRLQ
ncbi:lymphocyte antigen 75-like [Clytia hemisphaerica]